MADTDESDADVILDSDDVASWFKVSPRTVADWRNAGIGPSYFHLHGRVRYWRSAVRAYAKALTRDSATG